MRIINPADIPEEQWLSPKGKFALFDKEISVALGRDPASSDLMLRHPFDIEPCRVPAGKAAYPYHSHRAQWELYHVTVGAGYVRDEDGQHLIREGDAFIFGPGEAHQIASSGSHDLVKLIVADNPIGDSRYYPDSRKWLIRSPERRLIRSESLDHLDGEE